MVALKTERTLLRPIQPEDAAAIFSYASIPEVSAFTTWNEHKTIEDTLGFLNGFVFENYKAGLPDALGIELAMTGDFVGSVGCNWVSKAHGCMEIGFVIHPAHSGKGYATKACRRMLQHCFENFAVHRIQGRCHPDNGASVKVMERSGMTFEGRLRQVHRQGDELWDLLLFSVLKDEISS